MKLKVFTLRFTPGTEGGFDDSPLQEFIADKDIISFCDHFFVHEATPYLMLIVAYRMMEKDGPRRPRTKPDPRAELQAEEKQAYDALRTWRAERAKAEGIPPYMIASNKQLATMIKMRARSLSALGRIEGIGEAKIAKYGEEILHLLAAHGIKSGIDAASEAEGS